MKTTVDIPDEDLAYAMQASKAKTKREAIVTAIQDYNRRARMAALIRYSGTSETMMSHEDMKALEHKRHEKIFGAGRG